MVPDCALFTLVADFLISFTTVSACQQGPVVAGPYFELTEQPRVFEARSPLDLPNEMDLGSLIHESHYLNLNN